MYCLFEDAVEASVVATEDGLQAFACDVPAAFNDSNLLLALLQGSSSLLAEIPFLPTNAVWVPGLRGQILCLTSFDFQERVDCTA